MSIKAIPTEYLGVRFRSKSEAIFARALNILGYLNVKYEPQFFTLDDGYVPDFYIVQGFTRTFIEYKPKGCTDAYKECLHGRAKKLIELVRNNATFFLVEINPFADPYPCGTISSPLLSAHDDPSCWSVMPADIGLLAAIANAKNYRFDLDERHHEIVKKTRHFVVTDNEPRKSVAEIVSDIVQEDSRPKLKTKWTDRLKALDEAKNNGPTPSPD